ncbi:sensor histidine kinase [Geomesophilobacter sediminis]|uniref:Oxygen sensor histidine kinase NreB n=1 Tax=Geomesophilobacter sediminis TaxID=2798584 RepID=A0A8J7LUI5_9BACT|nr:PAS domain S-box protein [Geomesophilobacter sediminis]MBJ6723775.1 PAS domain S-box protein [Geomesophilobacter sediminis]
MESAPRPNRSAILRIVLIYFLFGLLWVWGTDRAVEHFTSDLALRRELDTGKAALFFVATSLLLYQLIGRYTRQLEAAQQSRRESESMLLRYRESAPVPVVVADRDGMIAEVNPAAAELLGRDRNVLPGMTILDLVPEEDRDMVQQDFLRVFQQGHLAGQYRLVTGSGRVLWVSVHAEKLSDRMIAAFLVDNTDQRNAEQTLRSYAHRLIEVKEDLRKRLAADLHDEIGRDLTAVGMNLSIIGKSLSEETRMQIGVRLEDTRRLLGQIHRSVRSIMSELRPPVLDERGFQEALVWYVDEFSARTGLAVRVDAGTDFPRLESRRELALFRVLQEALNNVWKHAGDSSATITLARLDRAARMCISDDGIGFDPQRSWDPQLGSGFGLTIMRERMEAVGGSLVLSTTPGAGTTVVAEIELKEE